jgi:hypothetical protein
MEAQRLEPLLVASSTTRKPIRAMKKERRSAWKPFQAAEAPGQARNRGRAPTTRPTRRRDRAAGRPARRRSARPGLAMRHLDGVRPARVGLAVAEQDQADVEGEDAEHQPARLLQEGHDLFRQGGRGKGDSFLARAWSLARRRALIINQGPAPAGDWVPPGFPDHFRRDAASRAAGCGRRPSSIRPCRPRSFITRLTISREAPIILAMSCLEIFASPSSGRPASSAISSSRRATRP